MIATVAMAAFAHAPVLATEVLEALAPQDHGLYIDGTIGGGGHARQILLRAPDARLIGIDRDPAALAASREVLADVADRVELVHAAYGDLAGVLADRDISQVDGLLLDLGVSSHQLDTAERGFSFTRSGPLDMRMDPTTGT